MAEQIAERVHVIEDLDALQVLCHPLRVQILEVLREPGSAATVARTLGGSRQKIHYHLKELVRVNLIEAAGERRSGNILETLYRSVAGSFTVSPQVAWHDPRRLATLRRQHSLEHLVAVGERLQRDAVGLLDRAAFDGEAIASAAVEVDVHFGDEGARAAFLQEYLEVIADLADRHGAPDGAPYRVVMAAHPAAESREGES